MEIQYWYCSFRKLNIDIGNINILLKYIAQQYIYSYPCKGSGASILCHAGNADLWITGEMSHHEALDAQQNGVSVLLCEHSNTERGFLSQYQNVILVRSVRLRGGPTFGPEKCVKEVKFWSTFKLFEIPILVHFKPKYGWTKIASSNQNTSPPSNTFLDRNLDHCVHKILTDLKILNFRMTKW